MNQSKIGLRLIIMNFLEFAVWGAYLTSMGSFLGKAGSDNRSGCSSQPVSSRFLCRPSSALSRTADPAQKTLSICQLGAGLAMLGTGLYAMSHVSLQGGAYVTDPDFSFGTFYALYTISIAFFMPTIALTNSVAYASLEGVGKDPVKAFPPIRVFGTIGFIVTMLFVNFMKDPQGIQYQHSYYQFFTSGILSLVLCLYALTLPNVPVKRGGNSFMEATGLKAFTCLKTPRWPSSSCFPCCSALPLQITNGYANPYLLLCEPTGIRECLGAKNANALIS